MTSTCSHWWTSVDVFTAVFNLCTEDRVCCLALTQSTWYWVCDWQVLTLMCVSVLSVCDWQVLMLMCVCLVLDIVSGRQPNTLSSSMTRSLVSALSLSLSLSVSVPSVTTHMDWTTWKSQGIASGHGKVRGNRNQVLQACKDKHIEWWNGSLALVAFCYGLAFSALTLFVGWQEGHLACKKIGGWWRCALLSPDGVAPSRMVGVSASVNFPLHHKVQKFSSGTGSPGWSRKKGRKTLVCVCVLHFAMAIPQLWYITGSK